MTNIDESILLFLNDFTGKYFLLDSFFYFFATFFALFLLFFILFFLLRNFTKYLLFVVEVVVAAFFARYALVSLIRYYLPRIRPFDKIEDINFLLEQKDSMSFPSGHTAFVFAISTVIYFYNRKIGVILFILSFLMGVTRIIVGVHWPSDILGGVVVGILSGAIVSELFLLFKKNLTKK